MAESKSRIGTAIAFLAMVSGWIATLVSVKGCSTEQERGEGFQERIVVLEVQVEDLQAEVQQRKTENEQQAQRLDRSLYAFVRHYREKVPGAEQAIQAYRSFDTPANREEYGKAFEEELNRRREEAIVKLQALVDHVRKWDPVLRALQPFFNGRFQALDRALSVGDEGEAFQSFARLRENLDSDTDRLLSEMDRAGGT